MGRNVWFLVVLFCVVLLSACAPQGKSSRSVPRGTLLSDTINARGTNRPTPIVPISLPRHEMTPTPGPAPKQTPAPTPQATPNKTPLPAAGAVGQATGAAPYGQPAAMTAEETQLTQQLFTLINSDREARGLPPYSWNATLAGGARLHSWNMYHCGFSHTCPDGTPQCQRIANEGFAGYSDCGENIGYAGPYPTAWQGVQNIQESMVNEPPTGWHRIHLFSTTLHRVGVGIYVDPSGFIWFTEDFVS